MKLNRIISFVLLFIYVMMTVVGVGFLRCGCTDSQRVTVMSFHPSCLCSDSTNECCQHNDQHHDEDEDDDCQDEDCCSFVYKMADTDHLNVAYNNDYQSKLTSLLFLPLLSVYGFMDGVKESADVKNNSPPYILLKIPLIYLYRQLRL